MFSACMSRAVPSDLEACWNLLSVSLSTTRTAYWGLGAVCLSVIGHSPGGTLPKATALFWLHGPSQIYAQPLFLTAPRPGGAIFHSHLKLCILPLFSANGAHRAIARSELGHWSPSSHLLLVLHRRVLAIGSGCMRALQLLAI
ncbi:hypothetical protein PENSPDRAFT_654963 [Peniophora sp. CONT]|nr:hypothetical protein PENSPDRAFT_654963 [Peniophora sp. CONT]